MTPPPQDAPPPATAGHELGFDLPPPASVSRGRAAWLVLAFLLVVGGVFAVAYVPRRQERVALAEASQVADRAQMRVETVTPKLGSSDRALSLRDDRFPERSTARRAVPIRVRPRLLSYLRR